jgi:hypothetical protein
MAKKDYSWFKFRLPDWMMGKIQKQKPEVRGVFINLVCKYWQKECKLSIVDAKEELEEVDFAYDSLIKKQIIKERGDYVLISFLDEQWAENQEIFERQSKGGKISAAKRYNADETLSDLQVSSSDLQGTCNLLTSTLQGSSSIKNEIREEENREDKSESIEEKKKKDVTPDGVDFLKLEKNVDSEMLVIFARWFEYKKARKEKYKTNDSLKTAFEKLVSFSDGNIEVARKIINDAIGNNYAGFFEPNPVIKPPNDKNSNRGASKILDAFSQTTMNE